MQRVCIFCGSSAGARPLYQAAAETLAQAIAGRGLELVYGGGRVGLMGAIADAALAAGGRVTGVMPEALVQKELAHTGLADLRIVGTMHERKALMANLADAFIALPGGFGTLDEFAEILTWAQLGFHRKPCAVLNTEGYFDPLLRFFDHAVAEGFVRALHRDILLIDSDPATLLERLLAFEPPLVNKWLKREDL